jgi:hypothetical protein
MKEWPRPTLPLPQIAGPFIQVYKIFGGFLVTKYCHLNRAGNAARVANFL